MTLLQWAAVFGVATTLLVIGAVLGRSHRIAKSVPAHHRWETWLGAFFIVVALGITADVINLQQQFRVHVTEHVKCMEDATGHLTTIALARRSVDEAAARYDQQFILWLSDNDGAEAANRESFIASIRDVAQARADMVKTYDTNPPIEC